MTAVKGLAGVTLESSGPVRAIIGVHCQLIGPASVCR